MSRELKGFIQLRVGVALMAFAVFGVVFASFGLSRASAAVECTGTNVIGEGAFLQKVANQEVWIPAFQNEVCNKEAFPQVEYRPQGSGAGLKAWGALGGSINRKRQFIGTDLAPTAAQIENIKKVSGGGNVLVIPVAQTTITVPVNPPAGCTITQIANIDLERIFRGVEKTWSELETATGTCNSPIVRVVRKDGAGTTYQFKHYLSLINIAGLPCTVNAAEEQATWEELEPISDPESSAPNTGWPETCTGKTLTTVLRPEKVGEAEVVRLVNSTSGSIGYASLPAVEAVGGNYVELQNNGLTVPEEATFATPRVAGAKKGKGVANCAETKYTVPPEARASGTGLDVDWSQTSGAQPGIGGFAYPLCTLTYDLAFHGYGAAGFAEGQEKTVRDFINGYLAFSGQTALLTTETNYAPVPEVKGNATFNVFAAMRKAAALISQ